MGQRVQKTQHYCSLILKMYLEVQETGCVWDGRGGRLHATAFFMGFYYAVDCLNVVNYLESPMSVLGSYIHSFNKKYLLKKINIASCCDEYEIQCCMSLQQSLARFVAAFAQGLWRDCFNGFCKTEC